MRLLVALAIVVTGCAKQATDPAKAKEPPAAVAKGAAAPVELASLIPVNTIAVSRFVADQFPITQALAGMTDAAQVTCWNELNAKVVNAYQIMTRLPRQTTGNSVFILEGDLSRAAVEACVPRALAKLPGDRPIRVTSEGDLVVFDAGALGKAYAAWRGRFVVAGDRESVTDALAGSPDGAAWVKRLAPLRGATVIASTDIAFAVLLRTNLTGWDVELTALSQFPEPVRLRGRLVLHAATPDDAATAAQRVRAGEIHFIAELPASLVEAIRRLKVTVRGTDVDIAFDEATFASISWDDMQQLQQRLEAALAK